MNLECVAPDSGPWPLHDAAASRAAESAALAQSAPHALIGAPSCCALRYSPLGRPGGLMQQAGFAVARLALALAPHAQRIAVFAGPGNNGGDGLVAATQLQRAGKAVQVLLLGDAARMPADAADALQRARAAGVPVIDSLADVAAHEFAIDALLGLGTRRAPEGSIAAAIEHMNAGRAAVLAVDLPSGLHPDSGVALGRAAVRATATLALLTLKPGLFTGHGRDLAGAVWLDRLGVQPLGQSAWLAGPPPRPEREHAQHKGSFGDVAVVGGAPGMVGAAWLAARAALAAGAGRVYCSLLDEHAPALDPARPELMLRARWWASAPTLLRDTTVVCGCGGGSAVREVLPALLSQAGRLILDADALNAVAGDSALQTLLAVRATRGRTTVLTPHPLEAARLLDVGAADVQADRVAAAQRLAARFGAVVVLKGSGSIVAAPGALPAINPTGNALLATAGTGDVLAGWIGGQWAQHDDAHAAAIAAVWQHGRAADIAHAAGLRRPLRAADLIEAMRSV